jgi:hypothetical protein
MAITTGFTAMLLVDQRPGMGPILVSLSDTHGIHTGDLPVVALWLVGLVSGALLLRDSGPR